MLFEVETHKSIDDVEHALHEAASRHRFGVLGSHDLERLLQEKGAPLGKTCRVYEICNPYQAKAVLEHNGAFASMLPCWISVYQDGNRLMLSTVLPTALLQLIPGQRIESIAQEVETSIKAIMQEAAR